MATKHHVVSHAGKLSPAQLQQIESDYERDIALEAKKKAEAQAAEKGKRVGDADDEGDDPEK